MGKKRTGEKLDQVLTEIRKLKAEVKILTKQQADLGVQVDKLSTKKGPTAPARKPVKKRAKPASGAQRKSSSAPKRPVLVAPPDAATG